MNITKGGAAAIGAAVIIISISGCAGVRSQVEQGSGAASVTSLHVQQDAAHREAALERAAANGVQRVTTSLKAQQDSARAESAQERSARAERSTDPQSVRPVSVSISELMRQQKQADTVGGDTPSAADMQGQRLAQYGEQFQAQQHETPVPTTLPRPISSRNR